MPSFVKVDLDKLDLFKNNIASSFIFVNMILVHDIKWLAFLFGPMMLVGSYFESKLYNV